LHMPEDAGAHFDGRPTVPLGVYIGSGTDTEGAEVTCTVRLMEKNSCWMDYKSATVRDKVGFHSEGSFTVKDDGDARLLRYEIGGLAGLGRAGQVYEFSIENGEKESAKTLVRNGVRCKYYFDCDAPLARKTCSKCGEPIFDKSLKVSDLFYHPACFVCDGCAVSLTGTFSRQGDGRRLCPNCAPKNVCEACGKAVSGKMTKVGASVYHLECFKCDFCSEPLVGAFSKPNGRLMCVACKESGVKVTANAKPKPSVGGAAADTATKSCAEPSLAAAAEAPKAGNDCSSGATSASSSSAMPLGSYVGKGKAADGADVTYAIRLNEHRICWLDSTTKTKISSGSWHAEGPYTEDAADDGKVRAVRFTVKSCPFGGGPKVGSVFEFVVVAGATPGSLLHEGVACALQVDVPEVDFQEMMKPVEEQPLPSPVPKPSPVASATPLPGEGMDTRLVSGSAGVMERKEVDKTSHSVVKMEAKESVPAPALPSKVPEGCLSLEELQNADVWKARGVDPTRREDWLSDDAFSAVFGQSRAAFAAYPKWRRDKMKKEHGLF